jgi:hypothetical protein
MGLASPGRRLSVFKKEGTIIGVVKDFHFLPLQYKVSPIVFSMNPDWRPNMRNVLFRVAEEDAAAAPRFVEDEMKTLDAGRTVILKSVDAILMGHYENEQRMEKIVGFFTFLTLVVALATVGVLVPRAAFLLADELHLEGGCGDLPGGDVEADDEVSPFAFDIIRRERPHLGEFNEIPSRDDHRRVDMGKSLAFRPVPNAFAPMPDPKIVFLRGGTKAMPDRTERPIHQQAELD